MGVPSMRARRAPPGPRSSSSSATGSAGTVSASGTTGRRSPGCSRRARPRTGPTGHSSRGRASSRTTAARQGRSSFISRTGEARCPCSPSTRTGPTESTATSSPHLSRPRRLRLQRERKRELARQLRPEHLRRHLQLRDFCYGFFPHSGAFDRPGDQVPRDSRRAGTVEGPGVTPDVMWAAEDIGAYDATVQQADAVAGAELGRPEVLQLSAS
jgi:hypothetical protein